VLQLEEKLRELKLAKNLLWFLKARWQHIASDHTMMLRLLRLRLRLLLLEHNTGLLPCSVCAIHHDIINRTACGNTFDADNLLAVGGFNDDFMVIHLFTLR